MREDELRRTLARADRPRTMDPEVEAATLALLAEGDTGNDPRTGLWAAIAACILIVVGFGVWTQRTSGEDQAAIRPVETSQPCEAVGGEIVDALTEWGSVRDWAIAVVRPEPDLAEVTARTLRSVLPDPDSSETVAPLEAMVGTVRPSLGSAVAEREKLLALALTELSAAVDADPTLCLAPGLRDFEG